MKNYLLMAMLVVLALSCETPETKSTTDEKNEYPEGFPYGNVPRQKPNTPMSAAFNRIYDGTYTGLEVQSNELFSTFKYTPLKGFDYRNGDATISRRDASKVIKANGKYYVWYTHRDTPTPPDAYNGNDTIPSRDWDLSEIWYATSNDGFTWEEQGVAVPRLEKPNAGWRSVSTADILVFKGKYYLYYQAYTEMPGKPGSGRGDYCPVAASVADSPDGPWTPANKVVIENGAEGTWDQFVIHDPYPLLYKGKIYLYYKGEMGGDPRVRAQGLAIGDDPFGPFEKHPLNPVINSGHETALFPFKEGLAAIVSRHGLEHNTIQYAPDGVNFEVASISSLLPIAPGAHVPDAFLDNGNGRGITWGLCHFRDVLKKGGASQSYSMLARFDCDLSLDIDDQEMKDSDIFNHPEINFKFGLSEKQKERIMGEINNR
ncbi:MAG: glycoside hydrolase [Cyclobacteriaceae bacterium]